MDTGWLKTVIDAPGPYVSVHMDLTARDFNAVQELKPRWAALKRQLQQQGASADVVETIQEVMLSPTGLGGPQGRSVIANADGVLMDQVLPFPPPQDETCVSAVPHLLPMLRGLSGSVPHALVAIDRTGADISVVGKASEKVVSDHVEGEHDVIQKVGGQGWSHRRYQMRAEDSWERNATAVAERLDSLVAEHHPELILVTGDDDARSYLHHHASRRVAGLLHDIDGSGRADGVHTEAFQQRLNTVLATHRLSAMGQLVARFEQDSGRHDGAANGLAPVVEALRTGAVQTLLLQDNLAHDAQLWAGDDPLHIGDSEQEVKALGSQSAVADRAGSVLLRAAVGQHAAVEPLEGIHLIDQGVGALLRFEARPTTPGGTP